MRIAGPGLEGILFLLFYAAIILAIAFIFYAIIKRAVKNALVEWDSARSHSDDRSHAGKQDPSD